MKIFKKNVSLLIIIKKNEKVIEKRMKNNLNKLDVQRSFWRANNINALGWAFYYVNDNKEVNVIALQTMCCIICHNNPVLNLNPKTKARKGLIIFNTINGIVALRKHVNSNHFNVFLKFEKMNCPLKEEERQPSKNRPKVFLTPYLGFCFLQKKLSRKRMCSKNNFWKTWVF